MTNGQRRRGGFLSGFIPDDFPLVTVVLLGVCVLFYFITVKATADAIGDSVSEPLWQVNVQYGAAMPELVRRGEWWRVFSAVFLHGGVVHLLMNGIALWQLGKEAEAQFGRARLMTVFIASGAAGMAAACLLGDPLSVVGASGGIFGLMGLVIAHAIRLHGGRFTHELRARFVPWLLYGLIFSFLPGISLLAHLGGFVAGAACGCFIGDTRVSRRLPLVWQVAAFAAMVWVAAAFVLATRSPIFAEAAAAAAAAG